MTRTFILILAVACGLPCMADTIQPQLPDEAAINKDAGRGNLLFMTLRLESGEEVPFFLDTGSTFTSFDKSLESKLGKQLGGADLSGWGVTKKARGYAAPKLYMRSTPFYRFDFELS